jgi:integrase
MSANAGRARNGEGTAWYNATRGRWEGQIVVREPDGTRRRRKVTGATENIVKARMRELKVDADRGLVARDKNITLATFLRSWIEHTLPRSVAPSTLALYSHIVEAYIIPTIGRRRLSSLSPSDVDDMIRQLSARGLSPNTQRSARSVLRKSLRFAIREKLATSNAATESDPVRVPQRAGRTLTVDEARQFLDFVDDDRLAAAWITGLMVGLRLGELLALEWSDLQLDTAPATLTVRTSLKRLAGVGLVRTETKTLTSMRTVHLPDQTIAALRLHRTRQLEERLAAGEVWEPLPLGADLVFRTEYGTAIDPANLRHRCYKLTEESGIGRRSPHELRHSAASLMLAFGVPLKVVSETLGHSSIRVTADVYGHLVDEQRSQAAEAMSLGLSQRRARKT